MTVSLVVRARNEAEHIGLLIDRALEQTHPPDEIIVVDSGSTDGTQDIALDRARVRLEKIDPADFTFGRSLNYGISCARGDVIVIASAHVYPVDDMWIEHLVSALRDPRVGVAYGGQIAPEGARWSEARVMEQWFPPHGGDATPFCNNANAAIRRSDWETQPYDEDLTGLEDIDWARRIVDGGRRVAFVPEATIVHVHEETNRQVYRRYRREADALAVMYPRVGLRPLQACALAWRHSRSDLADARRTKRGLRAFADVIGYRGAQYAGATRWFGRTDVLPAALARRYFGLADGRRYADRLEPAPVGAGR